MDYYDGLCLSGGGSKGILILGALYFFCKNKILILDEVKFYSGTSIGSVLCLLLNCGYTPQEILKEIISVDFFLDCRETHDIKDNFFGIINNLGLFPIDSFMNLISGLVLKKIGFIPTLLELKNITGKQLFITASNITLMREEKFSWLNEPDLNCIDAVKMSCNIPIIFQRIKYKNNYIVDGALINNNPWDSIPEESVKILNIVLYSRVIKPIKNESFGGFIKDDSFMDYIEKVLSLPILILSEYKFNFIPKKIKVIKINTENFTSPLQLSIDKNKKMEMYLQGYNEAEQEYNKIITTIL